MKIRKANSVPLITYDPFFSIWSSADHLYDKDTVHWCGIRQQIRGYVTVDESTSVFMGDGEFHEPIWQTGIEVTATATEYQFENEKIVLKVRFTSPLLPEDLVLVSRPCTYIDFEVEKKDAKEVSIDLQVSSDLVQSTPDDVMGFAGCWEEKTSYSYASFGRARQQPLNGSGDKITIDWGYAYLACGEEDAVVAYDKSNKKLTAHLSLSGAKNRSSVIIAYDDLLSINYFGQWRKAYWTKEYSSILEAIEAAYLEKEEVLAKAKKLDQEIEEKALEIGGENYQFLCNMSFRHVFAAHKLITDEEGNVIFLSKENDSNGCIGTVDVSYPSVPLLLLYNTEYVKGMMRPIFKFAESPVWEFDFAPHDVGRYPYAWGQVYGLAGKLNGQLYTHRQQDVYPPVYLYPRGSQVYDFRYQMPVEECGNMLIMTAAVCTIDGSAEFAKPYRKTLEQWTGYLMEYGADPGEQLCTDDFAGHLSHNVNLSVKAIMGIESYARILDMFGEQEEAAGYHMKAKEMAADWEVRAKTGDHYKLTFDNPDSWSMKYNLVWDKFFGSNLFSEEVYEKELNYYVKMRNEFGTPLDSRKDYTKSDWILWCAAMAEDRKVADQLIAPVAHYLENSASRVPFSDWYDTKTSIFCSFIARSVQGGMYMPMLMKKYKR